RPDFYAKISVAGQTFTDATQMNRRQIDPAWTTIKFVPDTISSIPIHYELWGEWWLLPDTHYHIQPAKGEYGRNFTFPVVSHRCEGDVNGVHDSPASAAISEGHPCPWWWPFCNRARIVFYITEHSLHGPPYCITDLGTLPSGVVSVPEGINNGGQVVGQSD